MITLHNDSWIEDPFGKPLTTNQSMILIYDQAEDYAVAFGDRCTLFESLNEMSLSDNFDVEIFLRAKDSTRTEGIMIKDVNKYDILGWITVIDL